MHYCKLCDAKVTYSHKFAEKAEVLRKHKICYNCFMDINGDYKKIYGYRKNEFQTCVMCGDPARPFGDKPVCRSAKCRRRFYDDREVRNQILQELSNGGIKTDVSIFRLARIGFKISIKPVEAEKTFLNGVKTDW